MKFKRIQVDTCNCSGCDIEKYFEYHRCSNDKKLKCVDYGKYYIYKRVIPQSHSRRMRKKLRLQIRSTEKLKLQKRMIELLEKLVDSLIKQEEQGSCLDCIFWGDCRLDSVKCSSYKKQC